MARQPFYFNPLDVKKILQHASENDIIAFKIYIKLPEDLVNHPHFAYENRLEWVVLEQFAHYMVYRDMPKDPQQEVDPEARTEANVDDNVSV
ncbi:hypothetical protein CPB84DRAFT_1841944 [Gymnopilus junonius]|uniref:Uncharacterized protein n=1 Tax=Gymnopilus junonius TaxID=109634 RepID=A0A9P5TTJ8_GYMJU|nr:hypothetical protein CPB84DRAFT_1841944 [Gymnopilus junonius]